MSKRTKTILRPDSIIEITREVKPRRVKWSDVAGGVRWVSDDRCETPWEDCDGWEHSFQRVDYLPFDDQREAAGYVCRSSRQGGSGLITLDDGGDGWGVFDYWRGRGAAKQVAAEMVAENRRSTLAQLVKWYENGWYYFGCVCEWGEYESSCWGFLSDDGCTDSDYFREEERNIVGEVVRQMEADGYIVTDKPAGNSPLTRANHSRCFPAASSRGALSRHGRRRRAELLRAAVRGVSYVKA